MNSNSDVVGNSRAAKQSDLKENLSKYVVGCLVL